MGALGTLASSVAAPVGQRIGEAAASHFMADTLAQQLGGNLEQKILSALMDLKNAQSEQRRFMYMKINGVLTVVGVAAGFFLVHSICKPREPSRWE